MLGLGNAYDVVSGVVPIDLQTARTGDYISLKNAGGVDILIFKGVGTDGDDQTFTLQQATTVAGGSAKDLAIITQYWEKEAVTDLLSTGVWTRVTQTAATTIAPGDPTAQYAAMYVVHVEADQLDVDNGFDCINMSNDGAGSNAQLGCILYILTDLHVKATPANLPNSIID